MMPFSVHLASDPINRLLGWLLANQYTVTLTVLALLALVLLVVAIRLFRNSARLGGKPPRLSQKKRRRAWKETSNAHPLADVDRTQPSRQPAPQRAGFKPRTAGAIFGGRFVYDSLLFIGTDEIRYSVVEKNAPKQPRFRVCSNPNCGIIHPPSRATQAVCPLCSSPLQASTPVFLLQEAHQPIFGTAAVIANRPGGLLHPNLRPPLAYFSETVGGEKRFCLVTPTYSTFPEHLETAQILPWGILLARGLDTLHKNKIGYGGQISQRCFGLDGNHPVWGDFTACRVPPNLDSHSHQADVRALAVQLYQWLTGKSLYNFQLSLPNPVNIFFQEAMTGAGYASGETLAQALEVALSECASLQSIEYRLGQCSDVGQERILNEDSLLAFQLSRVLQSISQPLGVFAVADGMGGHSAGEIASGTITNTLARCAMNLDPLQPTTREERLQWLKETVEAANKAVYDLRKSAGTDMGSTLVVALLDGLHATLANAGDSRIYLVNPREITQLTTDHSLVERLVVTGQITRSEARYHPQRNVVYRTVGDKQNLEIETSTITLAPGDFLLLCSDGLSGMLEDRLIQKIILESPSPQDACQRLIAAANTAGGEDNITAIVIQIITA